VSFSDTQIRALQRNIPSRNLRSRIRDGKELTYVEGWYAIHVANRIFGFDGWDRETLETRCVVARETRGSYSAVYAARVRVTVHLGERIVVRDGHGSGEGRGGTIGEVHDLALKAAETDATKRALATFGKAFGLALYANDRRKPEADLAASPPSSIPTDTQTAAPTNPVDETDGRGEQVVRHDTNDRVKKPEAAAKPGVAIYEKTPLEKTLRTAPVRLRIDKSALFFGETRRARDKEHLRYVSAQPCLLCGARPSDAHHLQFAQPRALGRKVGDDFTVPLCRNHHRELHHCRNEAAWWHDKGIDPIAVANQLWLVGTKGR
jgi:hypothetical protein